MAVPKPSIIARLALQDIGQDIGHQRPPRPLRTTSFTSRPLRPLRPSRPVLYFLYTSSTSSTSTSTSSTTSFTSRSVRPLRLLRPSRPPLYVLDDLYILATSLTTSTFSARPSPLSLLYTSFPSRPLCPSRAVIAGFLDVLCVHDVCSSVPSMPPPHPPHVRSVLNLPDPLAASHCLASCYICHPAPPRLRDCILSSINTSHDSGHPLRPLLCFSKIQQQRQCRGAALQARTKINIKIKL